MGGPLFGRLADRFGRRPVFLVDMLIFLVGSVMQFFVSDARFGRIAGGPTGRCRARVSRQADTPAGPDPSSA
ncbi:MFS transporter [Streptomyces sp. NPDC060000]|uniref:MFS transporter n=1 Tax=Streptomyces sp. NPDC060000 TaxID=3347031 RepID=UPI0036858E8C